MEGESFDFEPSLPTATMCIPQLKRQITVWYDTRMMYNMELPTATTYLLLYRSSRQFTVHQVYNMDYGASHRDYILLYRNPKQFTVYQVYNMEYGASHRDDITAVP